MVVSGFEATVLYETLMPFKRSLWILYVLFLTPASSILSRALRYVETFWYHVIIWLHHPGCFAL